MQGGASGTTGQASWDGSSWAHSLGTLAILRSEAAKDSAFFCQRCKSVPVKGSVCFHWCSNFWWTHQCTQKNDVCYMLPSYLHNLPPNVFLFLGLPLPCAPSIWQPPTLPPCVHSSIASLAAFPSKSPASLTQVLCPSSSSALHEQNFLHESLIALLFPQCRTHTPRKHEGCLMIHVLQVLWACNRHLLSRQNKNNHSFQISTWTVWFFFFFDVRLYL